MCKFFDVSYPKIDDGQCRPFNVLTLTQSKNNIILKKISIMHYTKSIRLFPYLFLFTMFQVSFGQDIFPPGLDSSPNKELMPMHGQAVNLSISVGTFSVNTPLHFWS